MPVVLTKAAVLLSFSRLPQSLSLSSVGSGHMPSLKASCRRQCCSRCSKVMMSALHGHISDSPTLNLLYMWALSPLCPVLNPEQNNLFWCVQFVEAVSLVVVWVLLLPSFLGERFDDGLFISVRGVSVLLFQLASLPGKLVCLFISLDPAVCWNPLHG